MVDQAEARASRAKAISWFRAAEVQREARRVAQRKAMMDASSPNCLWERDYFDLLRSEGRLVDALMGRLRKPSARSAGADHEHRWIYSDTPVHREDDEEVINWLPCHTGDNRDLPSTCFYRNV